MSAPRPHRSQGNPEEAGTVLVLFALLAVGLFGLLGVLIDGARLRFTQQQMLAGAENAALEGVRFKDVGGDAARRQRALDALARQWDDNFSPADGDAIGLGAGALQLVTGASPLAGTITVAANRADRVWKPGANIALNQTNAVHGDFVAGQTQDGVGLENDQFVRDDFLPSPAGGDDATLGAAPSFLVRLRRATARLELDRQAQISSAGPAFEWLWARGSAWQEPDPNDPNDRRQSRNDGLTVRATAIAGVDRALVVSNDPAGLTSLVTIALLGTTDSAWSNTPPGASITLEIQPSGILTATGIEQGRRVAVAPRTVGEILTTSPAPLTGVPAEALLVAAYGNLESGSQVVGFTLATAIVSGTSITITRLPGAVLPTAASSISPPALDARLAISRTPALRALHLSLPEPVLAPVLRR